MFNSIIEDRDNDAFSSVAQLPCTDDVHIQSTVCSTILRQQLQVTLSSAQLNIIHYGTVIANQNYSNNQFTSSIACFKEPKSAGKRLIFFISSRPSRMIVMSCEGERTEWTINSKQKNEKISQRPGSVALEMRLLPTGSVCQQSWQQSLLLRRTVSSVAATVTIACTH